MTTTAARAPLVRGEWLREGQHITAIGADDRTKCELDPASMLRARVFVDSWRSAEENGNLRRAAEQAQFTPEQLAFEIGRVLCGNCAARVSEQDITIATFVGIGAQDVVAAEVAMSKLGISPAV
jgi:ornithine cyclodeaminase